MLTEATKRRCSSRERMIFCKIDEDLDILKIRTKGGRGKEREFITFNVIIVIL